MQYSIQDLKNKLTSDALKALETGFEGEKLARIFEGVRNPRTSSFRINHLRENRPGLVNALRAKGVKFKDAPFVKDAFQLMSPEKDLENTDVYKQGKAYLQGLSGMLAPYLLDVKPGMRILDVAAAPGSKTTLLSSLMENKGIIHAIEPDYIRMERLKHNCKILGVENVEFFQTKAEKFSSPDGELYDAILADVPCSGEGRFNLYDPPSYLSYKVKDVPKFARLQLKILEHAFNLLKPNGRLVYSTCTLNPIENEGVIQDLLAKFPGQLKSIPIPKPDEPIIEFEYGNKKAGKDLNSYHYLRIYPSNRFEGFFYSVFEKLSGF